MGEGKRNSKVKKRRRSEKEEEKKRKFRREDKTGRELFGTECLREMKEEKEKQTFVLLRLVFFSGVYTPEIIVCVRVAGWRFCMQVDLYTKMFKQAADLENPCRIPGTYT